MPPNLLKNPGFELPSLPPTSSTGAGRSRFFRSSQLDDVEQLSGNHDDRHPSQHSSGRKRTYDSRLHHGARRWPCAGLLAP